jgi:hypothetical protein
MAERVYRNTINTQHHNAAAFYRGFSKIVKLEYAGAGESMVGEELYGADDLGTDGLHHEVYFRTGLQGQAALMPTDAVRQRFPMASYRTASMLIQGYRRIGIAHEHYPEDFEDNLPGFEWMAGMAQDLPVLVRDTEEDLHLRMYNQGENDDPEFLVGFAATPLFVDGSSYSLQLIGNPDYFSGTAASNIIDTGGGVSHAMLHLAKQYGRNFINEEGRTQPRRIAMILGREQNIELVRQYINHPSNIENFDPQRPNPSSDLQGVKLLATERLAQPNDLIFFFEGWQDFIKMRAKYEGRADTWEEGHAQFQKVVSQVRSRRGYYAYSNRLVVLMRGAA